jgi:hypothetical protein
MVGKCLAVVDKRKDAHRCDCFCRQSKAALDDARPKTISVLGKVEPGNFRCFQVGSGRLPLFTFRDTVRDKSKHPQSTQDPPLSCTLSVNFRALRFQQAHLNLSSALAFRVQNDSVKHQLIAA